MSLSALWATLAVLLPILAALIANLSSVDLAYHLRAGGEILDGMGIPQFDTYTFTAAGLPWADQQWGAQLVLAGTYRIGGWTGLVVLRAALVGVTFGLVYLACRLRGTDRRTSAWLSIGAFVVSAVALGLRPQLFGMALFAGTLAIVAARRRWPNAIWLIPILVAIWANVHGSFFLAPAVLVFAWLEDVHDRDGAARRTMVVAFVAALAATLNPAGLAIWSYAVGLSTNPEVTARITEWQPTTIRTVPGMLFFGSAFAIVVLLARRATAVSWPTLAWLGAFFLVGAWAIRGVAWWPLGAVVGIAPLLARRDAPTVVRTGMGRLNAALVGALVVAGVALLPVWRPTDPGLSAPEGVVGNAPSGITSTLRDLAVPGDRLFAPQPWGSWFEFAIPVATVAIDSRIELFPAAVWDDYEAVTSGLEGWSAIMDRWGATIAVVSADDRALAARLISTGWTEVHRDSDGSVLVRSDRSK